MKLKSLKNNVYPPIGFGTYLFKEETCKKAVETALNVGYRIIDTATFYENFKPLGAALKLVPRNEIYVISKVWPNAHTFDKMKEDLETTLKKLDTDYLDAYLLHWPNRYIPIEETMEALNKLKEKKLIRHIGRCNVTTNHLKRLLDLDMHISWVQVEMHPLFCDFELLDFCSKNNIEIQAWAPLARGKICTNELLVNLATYHNKTPAQVAIRWIMQHGCVPLPASQNARHIEENFIVDDFLLTPEEMKAIDLQAKTGQREKVTIEDNLGFTDEFDLPLEECWPIPQNRLVL